MDFGLGFRLDEFSTKRHCRILRRRVAFSDACFQRIAMADQLRDDTENLSQ